MSRQKFCFSFNTYNQALEIIKVCKNNNIIPILFVKSNLIEGLGLDWLRELRNMILNNYKNKDYNMYVDVRKNYGLFISLVEEKINFIKVQANNEMYLKLKQIAKINKVLINPNFSVVDLSKSKNKVEKLKKLLKKN